MFSRSLTLNCQCTSTYYSNFVLSEDCLPCLLFCDVCTNSSVCITCLGTVRQAYRACACPTTLYFDDNSTNCHPCVNIDCLTCTNASTCLTCQHPTRILPLCICPDGTYADPNSFACLPCFSRNCSTCVTAGSCATCFGLNRALPSCQCLSGFAPNGGILNDCVLMTSSITQPITITTPVLSQFTCQSLISFQTAFYTGKSNYYAVAACNRDVLVYDLLK